MESYDLLERVVDILEDGKSRDVKIIDVIGKTSVTDYLIIASGTSERHVKSLASQLVESLKQTGIIPLGVEGELVGDWVLVDLGDVIVHVMMPQTREFYQLEKLWDVDFFAEQSSESI